MPAIAGTAVSSMGAWDPFTLAITMCSVICMVSVVSLCTCCHRKVKNRDPDDVYGVVNPAAVTITTGETPCPNSVNFRSISKSTKISERHSQPSGKNGSCGHGSSIRASAPGRALPTLPPTTEIYTAIEKNRKEIRFTDEGFNPTYESIDPDADSFVDPMYSKVSMPPRRKDRKYDYPVFAGRNQTDSARTDTANDDVLYQSASQVYAGGSEDPYRYFKPAISARSQRVYRIPVRFHPIPQIHSITSDSRVTKGDFDSNSMCDPGYAKVKPTNIEAKRIERIEKTERELDQLYSKIRRSSRDTSDSPVAGPSRVTMDELIGDEPIDTLIDIPPAQVDSNSITSREPSYRYITVRENADAVRERLRQQGQLQQPIREHYYSVIGNDYETVGDTNSSTYSHVNGAQSSSTSPPRTTNFAELHVSTTGRSDVAPPPPTSPIPDRTGVDPQGTSTNSKNSGALTAQYSTSTVDSMGPRTVTDTYAVVSKPYKQPVEQQQTTTFGVTRSTISPQAGVHTTPLHWNAASLGTATSFAGLQRQQSSSSNSPSHSTSNPPQLSQSLIGIQEFMQRPTLPYVNSQGATVIGMRSTEERETIVENRVSNMNSSLNGDLNGTSRRNHTDTTSPSHSSTERVHNVEIKRIGPASSSALGANDIISARRYRSSSQTINQAHSANEQNANLFGTPLHDATDRSATEFSAAAGPSSPVSTSMYGSEGLDSSRSSYRSGLPLPLKSEETRRLSEKSKMRRQESLEREQRSSSARDSSTGSKDRSRERTKPWKEETEESKRKRLGTIYTANDYVSTIDMGTRRPWPMTGPSSPPSLRKSRTSDDEDFRSAPNNFSQIPLSIHTPNLFSWDLSETSSIASAKICADGDCDDVNCFCHSKSSRSRIAEGNLEEMRKISWNEPID